VLGVTVERAAGRRGKGWTGAATAAATFVAFGGTSLSRTGDKMAGLLDAGDVAGARRMLPSLCGRDPAALDSAGLARAALESVAENTSDAHVAPALWAAAGGVPAVLVYRGANTLDAMIGNRSPRYARFGWAAARFDDAANFVAARVTALLVAACAPLVADRPPKHCAWRRDAAATPAERGRGGGGLRGSAGVRLGGPTQYSHDLEIRPTLGDGRAPEVSDLAGRCGCREWCRRGRGRRGCLSAACRSGRRASPRS
jgi:adenosylcobinamide-phosphate synthase